MQVESSIDETGARAAISGYRRQALYTASLLLREAGEGRIFEPEGREDLAIYSGGRLERIVQVKAYSDPLRISDLEPQKRRSFFRRVLGIEEQDVRVELVSFGPLGSQLREVQEGDEQALSAVRQKLHDHGYSVHETEKLLKRLKIITVDESAVIDEVFGFLSRTMTSGHPARAFDLIVWWLLQAAEHRNQITKQQLRDRLQAVGRYLAEREAHHEEWFTTIKPLVASDELQSRPREELEREYYRGAAARYSHIVADLDVRREAHLNRIDKLFSSGKRVIILHGASGQGKTSLALRYFHEALPDDWRFLISAIDDRRHAVRIAHALADHLRSVNSPIYLLLDVAPRDLEWVTLLRELLDIENVRILVGIREEDLARRTATDRELGFPADLRLEFSDQEAMELYAQLAHREEAANAFPTFAEAWERFGGRGPLLEFVYLITQTESLKSVLEGQVRRLREEVQAGKLEPGALPLLHSCAVATAFEARVRLKPLSDSLDLRDPAGLVDLFEGEYLLRVSADRRHIEALHPVRSSLLSEVLEDPALARSVDVALVTLPYIPEEDLEVFVLYLLSRLPDSWDPLQEVLSTLELVTWTGVAGLGRALLWWGIRSFLKENRRVLNQAEDTGTQSLTGILVGDVAGASESDPADALMDLVENMNPTVAEKFRKIRDSLSPTSSIFEPLRQWLGTVHFRAVPESILDWESFAEVTFWTGRFELPLPDMFDLDGISISQLPIDVIAQISMALREAAPEWQAHLLNALGNEIIEQFQQETSTLLVEDTESDVVAHFVVPFELLIGTNELPNSGQELVQALHPARPDRHPEAQEAEDGNGNLDNYLNTEAVWRAELLKAFYPGKERYCTQGHGHQLNYAGVQLPHDSTHKRMPPTALPSPWLTRVNGMTHSLAIYPKRPDTWKLYAQLLLNLRETVATTFLKLKRVLISYFERARARNLFGGTLTEEQWGKAIKAADSVPYLPLSAVDEWGLSSETQRQDAINISSISRNIASSFALRTHASFSKAITDYTTAVRNFLSQARIILSVHGFSGRNLQGRDQILATAENELDYGEDKIRLSKHNLHQAMGSMAAMQRAFVDRVGGLVDGTKRGQVERRESALFPELWALWYQFCHFPEKQMDAPGQRAVRAFENELDRLRERLQRALESVQSGYASILREGFPWKDGAALVLQLDLGSITDIETGREEILALLGQALSGYARDSLRHSALSYYWSSIVIVPTFGRFALESAAWVVPSFVISTEESGASVDRPWLRHLQPLPPEQLHDLGLEASILSEVPSLNDLQERLAQVQLLCLHTASFQELLPQLDEIGVDVLEDYLSQVARRLGSLTNEIRKLLPSAIDAVRQQAPLDEADLEILIAPLIEKQEQLEAEQGQTITLDIDECAAEGERIQEMLAAVAMLRCLAIPGSIESIRGSER